MERDKIRTRFGATPTRTYLSDSHYPSCDLYHGPRVGESDREYERRSAAEQARARANEKRIIARNRQRAEEEKAKQPQIIYVQSSASGCLLPIALAATLGLAAVNFFRRS